MPAEPSAFLTRWHRVVAEKDLAGLAALLADDVALGAPPYWSRLEGKTIVQKLLGVIVETIEGFTYHRQWTNGRELALEFRGRVGGLELQGIDLITLDDAGRIAQLDVMIRPINALLALRDRVAERMAG
jgi:SnoaL-like protein